VASEVGGVEFETGLSALRLTDERGIAPKFMQSSCAENVQAAYRTRAVA
jgi:hypothetical protein